LFSIGKNEICMRNGKPYALLVEDELLVAMFAADTLREMGFEVAEALSGAKAIELAREVHNFEIAIIDLGLPDREGSSVVADLKALREDLPIIVASGQSSEQTANSFSQFKKLVVLSKPYEYASLCKAVEELDVQLGN
jgi:DNA-binding response OmpR family regulator